MCPSKLKLVPRDMRASIHHQEKLVGFMIELLELLELFSLFNASVSPFSK